MSYEWMAREPTAKVPVAQVPAAELRAGQQVRVTSGVYAGRQGYIISGWGNSYHKLMLDPQPTWLNYIPGMTTPHEATVETGFIKPL